MMPTATSNSNSKTPKSRLTPYHARYYAMLLSRRSNTDVERYLPAIFSANIDLHPHQIEAALFASRSPYKEGVILADEEGLGKTIEAGIALLQASIDGDRNVLILCPTNLRDYWRQEMSEKFTLSTLDLKDLGRSDDPGVVIMSYADASKQAEILAGIPWNLCVLDEAHLLATSDYNESTLASTIRQALKGRPKLLLTATPIQNSLIDLHHLVSFVDDTIFNSDVEAFRNRYSKKANRKELADKAQKVCQRTLRRNALTMPTTQRQVRTIMVEPTEIEIELSKRLSLWFHRDPLYAFPKVKEHYIRLTYWKLMASSWLALTESLIKVYTRLAVIPEAVEEQAELREIAEIAGKLTPGSRAISFLATFKQAMQQLLDRNYPEKALIFSENRATISFLYDYLADNGYQDHIVVHATGSPGKKALQAFMTDANAKILLATDSLGVGHNLTNCCLVINYDLPWNAQKLEQRISRCHRYGQSRDVLVLNFIDPNNRADRRLYDSLNKKVKQFDNLFGVSETIIGKVTESKNGETSPQLRSQIEIKADLQVEQSARQPDIDSQIQQAESDLLAYFDESVQRRFKQYGETIPQVLTQMENWLWEITRYCLSGQATFFDDKRSFSLTKSPYQGLRLSSVNFGMDKNMPLSGRYRLNHPLARRVLQDCIDGDLEYGTLTLKAKDKFQPGMSGEIGLWRISMSNVVIWETRILLCGYIINDGKTESLTPDDCAEILKLTPISCTGGRIWQDSDQPTPPKSRCSDSLRPERDKSIESTKTALISLYDTKLTDEISRLQTWAIEEEANLTADRSYLDNQVKTLKERISSGNSYADRFKTKQKASALERQSQTEANRLAELASEIRHRRDILIAAAKKNTQAKFYVDELFVIQYKIEEY